MGIERDFGNVKVLLSPDLKQNIGNFTPDLKQNSNNFTPDLKHFCIFAKKIKSHV